MHENRLPAVASCLHLESVRGKQRYAETYHPVTVRQHGDKQGDVFCGRLAIYTGALEELHPPGTDQMARGAGGSVLDGTSSDQVCKFNGLSARWRSHSCCAVQPVPVCVLALTLPVLTH